MAKQVILTGEGLQKLQEELDNDLAIVQGIELLNSRCQKHIETFQDAYKIYVEAMWKSELSDKDIADEEIADEYKKKIESIGKTEAAPRITEEMNFYINERGNAVVIDPESGEKYEIAK